MAGAEVNRITHSVTRYETVLENCISKGVSDLSTLYAEKEDDMEGLWTAEFGTASGLINGGVVMLQAGRIFGGDSGYYYVGKYLMDGETLTGELRANHYYGPRSTAFGDSTATFTVELTGKLNTTSDQIDGVVVRQGIGQVHFRLTKRATLA